MSNERMGGAITEYANECPGCGNLATFVHATFWPYYCHQCKWGFGHNGRDIDNESPIDERAKRTEES